MRANWAAAKVEIEALQPVYSVADYGAVGDGVANDTAAFAAVMSAAAATHGSIYIPPGHYIADIAMSSRVGMWGQPFQATLEAYTVGGYAVTLTDNSNTQTWRPYIRDININGASGTKHGVDVSNWSGVDLQNVAFTRCGTGVRTYQSYHGLFQNTHFFYCTIGWLVDVQPQFQHGGNRRLINCSFFRGGTAIWLRGNAGCCAMFGGSIEANNRGIVLEDDGLGDGSSYREGYGFSAYNVWFEGNIGAREDQPASITLGDATVVDGCDLYIHRGSLDTSRCNFGIVHVSSQGRFYPQYATIARFGTEGESLTVDSGGVLEYTRCFVPSAFVGAPWDRLA